MNEDAKTTLQFLSYKGERIFTLLFANGLTLRREDRKLGAKTSRAFLVNLAVLIARRCVESMPVRTRGMKRLFTKLLTSNI